VTFRYFRKQRLGTVQMGHVPPYILNGGGFVLPPLFGWDSFTSGLSQLPETLTLNGVDVQASLFYVGNDATTSEWVARRGANLPVAGAGADPVVGRRTPFNDGTTSVLFGGTGNKTYVCADTTTGDIGNSNAVIVCVFYNNPMDTTTGMLCSKKASTGATAGWAIRRFSNTSMRFDVSNGATNLLVSRTISTGWNIAVLIVNANGSATWGVRAYTGVSGVGSAGDPPVGPWSSSNSLVLGGGAAVDPFNNRIAFLGQWVGNFLPTDASASAIMDNINTEIQQRITGLYPQYFGGSPLCAANPRAASAYCLVDDGTDVVAELVGANWPRVGRFAPGVDGSGYVGERAATNNLLWSQDLSNAAWTKLNGSISGTATGPDKDATMQVFDSDGTTGVHGVEQASILTAVPYTDSWLVRPRSKTWAYVDVSTIADVSAYFDLANGVVGTVGSAVLGSGMEQWTADGLWRVWITYDGTAASHNHRCLAATGDGGVSYAGPTANELDIGWAQSENVPGMSTPIRTTTATVSRITDSINFDAAGNYPGGSNPRTVVSKFAARPYTPLTVTRFVAAIINSTVEFEYHTISNANRAQVQTRFGGVTLTATDGAAVTPLDGAVHTIRSASVVGDVKTYLDGTLFGTLAPAGLPTTTRIYLAGATAATSKLSGVMPSFRIYDQAVAPGEQGTGNDT